MIDVDAGTCIGSRNLSILALRVAAIACHDLSGLDVSDIAFEPAGVQVRIRDKGLLAIPSTPDSPGTCPVKLLRTWLTFRGDGPGPLYSAIDNGILKSRRLAGETLRFLVKHAAAQLGLDPARFSTSVFQTAATDLTRLESERTRFTRGVLAPRTLFIYRYGWRHFVSWCEKSGISSLPCTSHDLALYAVAAIGRGLKVSTAAVHIAAVIHQHKITGHTSPLDKNLQNLLSGARRTLQERPIGKKALSVAQLLRIVSVPDTTAQGERDRAILILGFATGLRREELSFLNVQDLLFVPEGLKISVRKSKTDQQGIGREIGLWPGRVAATCPVQAARNWLAIHRPGPGPHTGPLFPFVGQNGKIVSEKRISGESICQAVKRQVKKIGLNPAAYGGHSLRSGCVTSCVIAGASVLSIMQRTGHRSVQTIHRYVRTASVFDVNPMDGVL